MFNILSIVLAGAALLAPHHEEQPSQRVTLGGLVFFPSGKTSAALQQRFQLSGGPATWYVFTGKTLCEGQTVSASKPLAAGNGWRVELSPGAGSGSNAQVQVKFERLWMGGKAVTDVAKTATIKPGSPVVLDSIDGGARLQRQDEIERLKSTAGLVDLNSPRFNEFADGRIVEMKAQLAELEQNRRLMLQRLGAQHPQVLAVDSQISAKRREMQDYWTAALPRFLEALRTAPVAPIDGCDALSMNLNVTAETTESTDPTETEVWLVHKDPAGVETVQRQVVRSAGGNGSFVFDDLVIQTSRGPVTVEVNGGVRVLLGHGEGGQAWLVLDVNRRYVSGGTAFGWKTKEGGTGFTQNIRPDEVLAFNLLPLKDDEGVLVGHRFSVRVRTKILK